MSCRSVIIAAILVGLVQSRGIDKENSNTFRGNKVITSCSTYALDTPENGHRSLQATTVGSTAKFDCSVGFVLVGQAISTCLPNGQWSSKSPWCRPVCEYTTCPSGTKCEFNFRKAKPTCRCNGDFDCPLTYQPVCGSDGMTYVSQCALDTTACRQDGDLEVTREGLCSNEDKNATCPMCPRMKRCSALYKSKFALTGKVVKTIPSLTSTLLDLIVQVDEVYKGYEFFKPGMKSVIKVQLRSEVCPCVPQIPTGKALIMGKTIVEVSNDIKVPVIDELSFVEKYYSPKQLGLCWLY